MRPEVINVIVAYILARDRTENRIPLFLITRWGSKVLIGHDASGRHKLKIKTSLFGLWTRRYNVDAETMDMLRVRFAGTAD
jgi:hypothetical protein